MKGEGYVMIDHRHSEGVPDAMARHIGLTARDVGAGRLFEAAILKCTHCPTPYVKNPDRTRERHHCKICNHYICDGCASIAALPGYVHRPYAEVVEAVTSGKFTLSGPVANPILVPVTP